MNTKQLLAIKWLRDNYDLFAGRYVKKPCIKADGSIRLYIRRIVAREKKVFRLVISQQEIIDTYLEWPDG